MNDYSDFSEYPQTIGEIASDRDNDNTKWSVRDMLIRTLRDIDQGKFNPTCAVLIYSDGKQVLWKNYNTTSVEIAGMCAIVSYACIEAGFGHE